MIAIGVVAVEKFAAQIVTAQVSLPKVNVMNAVDWERSRVQFVAVGNSILRPDVLLWK